MSLLQACLVQAERPATSGAQGRHYLRRAKFVYLEDSKARLTQVKERAAKVGLHPSFLPRVHKLMNHIHATYGIAISVCPDGGLRTFKQQQSDFERKTSKAGPGEGLHCYGFAVDLGFEKLQWMQSDGSVIRRTT